MFLTANKNSIKQLSRCPALETILLLKQLSNQSFSGQVRPLNRNSQTMIGVYGTQFNIGDQLISKSKLWLYFLTAVHKQLYYRSDDGIML